MNVETLSQLFPIQLPIAKDGVFWNGKPDEFSNIGNLNYSQKYGLTKYAKTGVYGYKDGKPREHNGHDFAGQGKVTLAFPCKAWVSWVGWDPKGYGYFIFFETEEITKGGEVIKMQYVLAHFEKIFITARKWYELGQEIGLMGSTGMSSGPHTHFAGRPMTKQPDGSFKYLFAKNRGYVDLTDFFVTKPIYDKQILINEAKNNMDLKNYNNYLVQLVEAPGGFGLIVDGKLIVDDTANLLASWAVRNNGKTDGKTVTFNKKQWDSVPHYNLKLEKI